MTDRADAEPRPDASPSLRDSNRGWLLSSAIVLAVWVLFLLLVALRVF